MKKALAFILCAVMLAALAAFSVSAEVRYTTEEPTGDFVLDRFPEHFDSVENEGDLVNYEGGDDSALCLKNGSAVTYNFTAEKAGTYTFAVKYVARVGTVRGQDYAIDGGARVYCELELCDDNSDQRWWMFDADLEAGAHTVTLATPTGFDDSTIKSCDIYQIVAWLSAEKIAEPEPEPEPEPVPAAEEPIIEIIEPAPEVVEPVTVVAAQTFDAVIALIAVCAASAAVVIKKR